MKNLLFYIYYDLGAVLILVGLPVLVLVLFKRKPALWRTAFASEVVLLFLSFGNCFVPGTWSDFWISEAVDYGFALTATIGSILLARHAAPVGRRGRFSFEPQVISLLVVTILIVARIAAAR